jgi:protocatechuate 3,4-dioxygenase beta subunit
VLHTGTARYFEGRTGADGRFSVGPLPEETSYHLVATHPGKLTGWLPEEVPGPLTEDLILYAPRRIVGTVVDGDRPIPNATVTEVEGERVVTTDAQGRFAFEALSPGDYHLTAEQGGLEASERVALPEEQREARVTLRLGTVFRVEATVRDAAGKPVPGAQVSLDRAPQDPEDADVIPGPIFVAAGTADENGRVRLGPLEAGEHTFQVEADRMLDLVVTRSVAPGAPALEFVLTPALLVEGQVTDTEGKPVAEAALTLVSDAPSRREPSPSEAPRPGLRGRRFSHEPSFELDATFNALSDAQGRFALKVDRPLSGKLTVEAPGFLPRELQVQAPTAGLKVALDSGATVRGTVTNSRGEPVTDVDITVMKQRAASGDDEEDDGDTGADSFFAASAEEDGRFAIHGVQPGTYAVWLRATTGGYERQMPERVMVRGTETVELALRLDMDGRMGGIVVDARGQPLAGVEVEATAKEQEGSTGRSYSPLSTKTGPDGRFVLEPLARDWDYELEVTKPGYALPRPPVEPEDEPGEDEDETLEQMRARMDRWVRAHETPKKVARAGNMEVRIVMNAQNRVTGRLVKADGAPLTRYTLNDDPVRDPRGAFSWFVDRPGRQRLTFTAPGYALTVREVDAPAGRDVDLGTVRMDEGRTVKGRVVDDATGAPLEGVHISLSLAGAREEDLNVLDTSTARDGTFTLPSVEARPYQLTAMELDHETLRRDLSPTDSSLELRMVTETLLEVTVKYDQGGPRATTPLLATPRPGQSGRRLGTARDGVAQFRDMAPGEYVVGPLVPHDFTVSPREVRVEPHRVTRLELTATTLGTRVTLRWSEHGRQGMPLLIPNPAPAVGERSSPEETEWMLHHALTPDRPFGEAWNHVPPGSYTLLITREHEGRRLSSRQDVTVGAGPEQGVDVVPAPW